MSIVTEDQLKKNFTDEEILEGIDRVRALELATDAVAKFERVDEERNTTKPKKTASKKPVQKRPAVKRDDGTKTYVTAGVSTVSGTMKLRFANNSPEQRTKILERAEHDDIRLAEMEEGTRLECVKQMATMDLFQDEPVQELINAFIEANS